MSLYLEKIDKIKIDDVKNFLNVEPQRQEGINLEFKSQFPNNKKLSEGIAALANTRGGLMLVGVEEEPEGSGKAKKEPTGIPLDEHVRDRIDNIIQSNIYPYLMPEITYLPLSNDPNETKMIVLIRVWESESAPHYTPHKEGNSVYVRHLTSKDPEVADHIVIERLIKRRELLYQQRGNMIQRSKERAYAAGISNINLTQWPTYPDKYRGFESVKLMPVVCATCLPKYPNMDLFKRDTLQQELENLKTQFHHGTVSTVMTRFLVPWLEYGTQVNSIIEFGSYPFKYFSEVTLDGQFSVISEPVPKEANKDNSILVDSIILSVITPILLASILIKVPIQYHFHIELIEFMENNLKHHSGEDGYKLPHIEPRVLITGDFITEWDKDHILKITENISEQLAWAINKEHELDIGLTFKRYVNRAM
ncbi:ATP-binding protein [bacterium]|nr:ATP-binding protein [bacterium]